MLDDSINVLLYLQVSMYLFVQGHLQSPSTRSVSVCIRPIFLLVLVHALVRDSHLPSISTKRVRCCNFITVFLYLQVSLYLFVLGHLQTLSTRMAINFKLILGIIGIISLHYHYVSLSFPVSNYPFLRIL
jgi:hypothetical protein